MWSRIINNNSNGFIVLYEQLTYWITSSTIHYDFTPIRQLSLRVVYQSLRDSRRCKYSLLTCLLHEWQHCFKNLLDNSPEWLYVWVKYHKVYNYQNSLAYNSTKEFCQTEYQSAPCLSTGGPDNSRWVKRLWWIIQQWQPNKKNI